ncbi:hypothetical protein IFM89_016011 [Coptis chinensis]|uniref:Uncharacterized protein n=1 Tax=Coptis chinensis TaxID=261450 RepID=A0A835IEC0_9MAGN|nr:hypothetical protein IFM89_016011 [Coptis chinensis]
MYDTAPTSPSVEMVQNQIGEPRAEMVQNQLGEPWKTGLFDCQQNPANARCSGSLIYLFLMPLLCSQLVMGPKYRAKLRKKFNLVEAPYGDCFSHAFCPCCALCQEFRELQSRGLDPNPVSGNEIDETGPDSAKAETINNHTEEPRAEIVQNQIGEPWITGLFDCHQNRTNAIMTAFLPCMAFGQIAEVLDGGKMRWNGLLAQWAMQQRYPDQIVHPPQNQTMSK